MLALLTISFIGYAIYLNLCRATRALETLFITCCLAIIFLYLFGIFGHLRIGFFVFLGMGILLGSYAVTRPLLIKDKLISLRAEAFENLAYLAFATPFLVAYFLIADNFLFTGWDEFSFWATSSKMIYEFNSLYTQSMPIGFKHYPPAQQLFQYLFLSVAGWSEKTVLYAQSFLTLTAILYSTAALVKGNLTRLTLFFSFCIVVYIVEFHYSFSHIYADPLLGAVFCAALISASKFNGKILNFACTLLFTAVLVLVKEIGLILALIVFFAFSYNAIWSIKNDMKSQIFYLLGFALFLFLTFESWQIYLHHIGSHKAISPISLTDYFLNYDRERLNKTLLEFDRRLFKSGYLLFDNNLQWGNNFSVVTTSILLATSCIFIGWLNRSTTYFKNTVILSASLILGFVIYIFFLLFTYLVFFSAYEGIRLASFERYTSSYMLAWIIISLLLIFRTIESRSKWIAILLSSSLLYLLFYCSPYNFKQDFQGINTDPRLLPTRIQIQSRVDAIKAITNPTDSVYFIHQNSTGYERIIFHYLIAPNPSSDWCWSVGRKYYPGDVWTCDQNLSDLLKSYNYLVINQADEQFWEANSFLFEKPQSGRLSEGIYKRVLKPNGSSYFQKIN